VCLTTLSCPSPDDDKSLGALKDWKDFLDIEIPPEHLTESQTNRVIRINEEQTHTVWHRFVILGRSIVTFTMFEALWNNFNHDPLQLQLVAWYRYMYHVDHKLDVPKNFTIGRILCLCLICQYIRIKIFWFTQSKKVSTLG
jgi:hypothetical protein